MPQFRRAEGGSTPIPPLLTEEPRAPAGEGNRRSIGQVFLVGCPRSGTTLLQSLLAAHSSVVSFPESHFFAALVHPKRACRVLGLANPCVRGQLQAFLSRLGPDHADRYPLPPLAVSTRSWGRTFLRILDDIARVQGKAVWVEKTPRHLYHLATIERLTQRARFVHVIRRGQDVVASLYEVTHTYPEVWQGARSVQQCVDRWIGDVSISLAYRSRENHFLAWYERLVDEPRSELERICAFLGIPFQQEMLTRYKEAARALVLREEAWKARVHQDIARPPASKFDRLFSEDEKEYVNSRVEPVWRALVSLQPPPSLTPKHHDAAAADPEEAETRGSRPG